MASTSAHDTDKRMLQALAAQWHRLADGTPNHRRMTATYRASPDRKPARTLPRVHPDRDRW
jgi:hypothetical protein